MAIFLVVPTGKEAELKRTIAEEMPEAFYELPRGEYLISFTGTSKELSDRLGITDGSNGLGIVVGVSGYYGRAPTGIWEWIKSRWSS